MIDLTFWGQIASTALAAGAIGYVFGFGNGENSRAAPFAALDAMWPADPTPDPQPIWHSPDHLRTLAANERAVATALGALAPDWHAQGLDQSPEPEIIACHRRAIALEARALALEGGAA